jgi:hypothetical protein
MMPFVRRRVKSNEIVYVTNVGKNVVFYLNIHVLSFVDDYCLVDCIDVANPVTEEIVQLVPTLVLTNYPAFVGLK